MPIQKGGEEITSLEDWARLGKPKRKEHWVKERSAMEVARSWLHDSGKTLPAAVTRLLLTHKDFGPVVSWFGEPEAKLKFDAYGEPRNTDILVTAKDLYGAYVLAVEAKADEKFGDTVEQTLDEAQERKATNSNSNGVNRVEHLIRGLFGNRESADKAITRLRYQLLTATAGTLCEAERRGADRAILMIHEFVTQKTSDKKHLRNAHDLNCFLSELGFEGVLGSDLIGPLYVPGTPLLHKSIRLYIGKVSENLRTSAE